jgi:hypothetical protein
MPGVRHRRFRNLAVATIAATLMAVPVKAETPRDIELAEGLVIPTSIEGRSLAAWAAEAMVLTLLQPDAPIACRPDPTGRVVMLVRAGSDCMITDEQMLFVPIVAQACISDDRLSRRAERATGQRQDRLWSRVNAQEAAMFRCLYVDLQALERAFLSVDGREIRVDGTLFSISDAVTIDGRAYRWPGFRTRVPSRHDCGSAPSA